MYICKSVYMYICIYVYMYVCMYICIYIYMYICIFAYINTNYFKMCFTVQKIPCAWQRLCGPSRAVWQFSAGICNTIEDARPKVAKVSYFTVHFGVPARAARICQHYRGFVQVGRCGTGTVRSGQKVDGKIRHFRTEGCAVPEREAGSVFGPPRAHCYNRYFYKLLPPWPIDGPL